MKKRRNFSIVIYVVLLVLFFSWVVGLFTGDENKLIYSDIVRLVEQNKVTSLVVEGTAVKLELTEPFNGKKEVTGSIAFPEQFREKYEDKLYENMESGVLKFYDFVQEKKYTPYDFILPALIVAAVVLFICLIFASRSAANGTPMSNFGKARTKQGADARKVSFEDVAGMDEEKLELQEVVDFLKNPDKYTKIGAKIPHGILMSGPPGTGKTLRARATAGEAGVEFLSISGSDFMELYVGVGASRVRDLFDQAKKVAPSIIFIDEIDAIGRKRGSGMGGGHDEREQTLNQMLVEMDGFTRTEGVIVLAATNRPDILDPALLRPGRFDRQIHVSAPDVKGREEILKVHAKGKCLDGDVDLKVVARATVGFTGADLSNLLNEAAIMAARAQRPALNMQDLNDAMMKISAGPERRSRVKNRRDLKNTAIHEAGHAVAMYFLPTAEEVRHITIVPRGNSLGATWHFPKDDTVNMTRNEMYERIVFLLGGRVAEDLFTGDISVGASNDIDRATALARDMVARYGMCEKLGTISYISDDEIFVGRDFEKTKGYSEKYAAIIDDEVKDMVDRAYAHCKKLLSENEAKLNQVVDFLLEHESMTGSQFAQCMRGEEIGQAGATVMFESSQED